MAVQNGKVVFKKLATTNANSSLGKFPVIRKPEKCKKILLCKLIPFAGTRSGTETKPGLQPSAEAGRDKAWLAFA